jgi:hypothetical protein
MARAIYELPGRTVLASEPPQKSTRPHRNFDCSGAGAVLIISATRGTPLAQLLGCDHVPSLYLKFSAEARYETVS